MKPKNPQLKFDLPKGQPRVFRQRELDDESPFPFGKWKGTLMKNVPSSFLDWVVGQDWAPRWPAVINYVNRTRNAINQDLKRQDLI